MRKSDARKWLHATLDLLPVILIPVFMIYSHRHTIDSGSIQVPQNKVVDFNQLMQNGNFANTSGWFTYQGSISVSDNQAQFILDSNNNSARIQYNDITFNTSDIYLVRFYITSPKNTTVYVTSTNGIFTNDISISANQKSLITGRATFTQSSQYLRLYCNRGSQLVSNDIVLYEDVNVFNLTKMFGDGNEPSNDDFNSWFRDSYYSYTLSNKQLLKGYTTITYEDSDIMSQMTYQLYNSVDKYFNMGNVFNLTGVYDWFNLNIFNGNAPIIMYIVWNIALYELIMDLLFLLYGLFMFFIDSCTNLMERFNCQLRGR